MILLDRDLLDSICGGQQAGCPIVNHQASASSLTTSASTSDLASGDSSVIAPGPFSVATGTKSINEVCRAGDNFAVIPDLYGTGFGVGRF
jgi:hypothetical protein